MSAQPHPAATSPRPASSPHGAAGAADRYVMPSAPAGQLALRMLNSSVAALNRVGLSIWGSRVLYVRGRTSGEWRSTPVNVLPYHGQRYLVAPRGQTQWVRNLRAAGSGELRAGGAGPGSTDDQRRQIASGYPGFQIIAAPVRQA